jgi:hypothetical protein
MPPSVVHLLKLNFNPVYVTLASNVLPAGAGPVMLTYVKLAVGNGGAFNQSTALANTWAQFSTGNGPTNSNGGPAHVETWDRRRMSYYTGGFNDAAIVAAELVTNLGRHYIAPNTYTLVPSTWGQCGSFASLLQSALAMNGIPSIWVDVRNVNAFVSPPVPVMMVIKNWTFGSPSYPLKRTGSTSFC